MAEGGMKVRVKIRGKQVTFDYEGMPGDCCFEKDAKVRAALKKAGLDVGEAESVHCKIGATPLQPRVATPTGT